MELTSEIKSTEADAMANGKENALFYAMLNGQTVTETIQSSRGEFQIKFPKQDDLITISRIAACMRNGIPAVQFDNASEYEIQKVATLDVMVSSGPAWFNKIKKDADFSWGDMPDANFADEIYAKAVTFRQRVQATLRGVEGSSDNETSGENAGGVPSNVGDGLFSGTSGSAKRN